MDRRRVIEIVIVGLWLTIAVMLYLHFSRDNRPAPVPEQLAIPTVPDSEKGKKFDVRRVTVLRGDTFDLTMGDKDSTRILGKLTVMATDNAKPKVLDILNHSTNPRVVLREKQPDGRWVVDLYFTSGGKELNMAEWLVSNNLVYK